MKKILALVLAVAMMATLSVSAFAAVDIGVGSTSLTANPGNTLRVQGDSFTSVGTTAAPKNALLADWRFGPEYFTISSKTFTKGSNLVKEVKFNETEMSLDIVLNDNYTLSAPNGENLVIKKLAVKAKDNYDVDRATSPNYAGTDGDIKKGVEYIYGGNKELKIGFPKYKVNLDGSTRPAPEGTSYPVAYKDDQLVEFVAAGGTNYETVSLDDAADLYIEGRVYDGDKVYVAVDNAADTDVLKAAPDDADLRFYNIKTNGFPTANLVQLAVEEEMFVYKYAAGKLSPSGMKWNADTSTWDGKIRSSVSYVVSDVELKASVAAPGEAETPNPDTGANDVVGIAAALAIVSLVAAGAVSLKK